MIILVILGWLVVTTSIAGLFIRPWKTLEARAPFPMGASIALGVWVLWIGGQNYADLTDEGLWTGATLTIVYIPLKAVLYALLGYYAARAAQKAWSKTTTWRATVIIGAIIVALLGLDVVSVREGNRQRVARNIDLAPERIQSLERRVVLGKASPEETYMFLENPLCPPSLLAEKTSSPDQLIRIAVAKNPTLDPEIVTKLANDTDAEVRYYAAHHKALPLSQLQRLAHDPSEKVRAAVAWKSQLPDEDFNSLIDDPSPSVRATIVLQTRLSDANLRRLMGDADERVRVEAQKIAAKRGLE